MQDGSNVAKEPAACEVEPTKPVCPSLLELGFTIAENDAVSLSTSSAPVADPTTPGSHSPCQRIQGS